MAHTHQRKREPTAIAGVGRCCRISDEHHPLLRRYARHLRKDGIAVELARDTFYAVASPSLLGSKRQTLSLREILRLPVIETGWPDSDVREVGSRSKKRDLKNDRHHRIAICAPDSFGHGAV